VKLATHLYVIIRLRMSGTVPLLPLVPMNFQRNPSSGSQDTAQMVHCCSSKVKQVPCCGPPNILCPHIKLSTLCYLEPNILCVWSIRVATEKLFYHKLVTRANTLFCPCFLPHGRRGSWGVVCGQNSSQLSMRLCCG
jgi:hypothetical protein